MNKYNVQLLQIKRMNYQFIPTGIKYVRFGACRVVDAPGQDVSLLCFSGEQNGARLSRQESARGDVSLTDRFVKGIFHQKNYPYDFLYSTQRVKLNSDNWVKPDEEIV